MTIKLTESERRKRAYKALRNALDELEDVESNVRARRHAFLEACGWKSTCNVPGARSLWLWEGTLPDGRVAILNEATAIVVATDPDWADEDEAEH
jgi:hypothetical protein